MHLSYSLFPEIKWATIQVLLLMNDQKIPSQFQTLFGVTEHFKSLIKAHWPRLFNLLGKVNRALRRSSENNNTHNYDSEFKPYEVKMLLPTEANRKKIMHVIANFWTGGSARLVIDLIEHLGHCYEQEIITRDVPSTPAYTNVTILVCREMESIEPILTEFNRFKPQILHIHFLGHHRDVWGEEDWKWYDNVFNAAKEYGCKIIENINIPTDPYISDAVSHYVYVSNYVKQEYGLPGPHHKVIFPGSDFSHFTRSDHTDIPDNCIGMVYRLEGDKINISSIDVFIDVVKRRKGTKALIVGGGNLMIPYRNAVTNAGLNEFFTFTGYVGYESLPDYYKKMSIFVAPVHKESFGQVTPFAMNMGIPVAGFHVGALPEIIANDRLLAPPGETKTLSNIIIELLDNRERRLQIGAANHLRAKKLFSVKTMIRSYEKIYDEMMVNV